MRSLLPHPSALVCSFAAALAVAVAVGAPARAVEPPCRPGEAAAAPCDQLLPPPCEPSTAPCQG